jgi:septal ring factor EnvC (AmiA/AmiB activator)
VENKNLMDNGIALESQVSALRKHTKTLKCLEQDLKSLRQEKDKVDSELKALKM